MKLNVDADPKFGKKVFPEFQGAHVTPLPSARRIDVLSRPERFVLDNPPLQRIPFSAPPLSSSICVAGSELNSSPYTDDIHTCAALLSYSSVLFIAPFDA